MSVPPAPVKTFGPLDVRNIVAFRRRLVGSVVSVSVGENGAAVSDGSGSYPLSPLVYAPDGSPWNGDIVGMSHAVDLVGAIAASTFPIAAARVQEAQREIESLERNLRVAREKLAAAEADRDTLIATVRASIARHEAEDR